MGGIYPPPQPSGGNYPQSGYHPPAGSAPAGFNNPQIAVTTSYPGASGGPHGAGSNVHTIHYPPIQYTISNVQNMHANTFHHVNMVNMDHLNPNAPPQQLNIHTSVPPHHMTNPGDYPANVVVNAGIPAAAGSNQPANAVAEAMASNPIENAGLNPAAGEPTKDTAVSDYGVKTSVGTFKCELCNRYFFEEYQLKCHFRSALVHRKDRDQKGKKKKRKQGSQKAADKTEGMFVCVLCNETFPSKGALLKHCETSENHEGFAGEDSDTSSVVSAPQIEQKKSKRKVGKKMDDEIETDSNVDIKKGAEKAEEKTGERVKCSFCCLTFTSKFKADKHEKLRHKKLLTKKKQQEKKQQERSQNTTRSRRKKRGHNWSTKNNPDEENNSSAEGSSPSPSQSNANEWVPEIGEFYHVKVEMQSDAEIEEEEEEEIDRKPEMGSTKGTKRKAATSSGRKGGKKAAAKKRRR